MSTTLQKKVRVANPARARRVVAADACSTLSIPGRNAATEKKVAFCREKSRSVFCAGSAKHVRGRRAMAPKGVLKAAKTKFAKAAERARGGCRKGKSARIFSGLRFRRTAHFGSAGEFAAPEKQTGRTWRPVGIEAWRGRLSGRRPRSVRRNRRARAVRSTGPCPRAEAPGSNLRRRRLR